MGHKFKLVKAKNQEVLLILSVLEFFAFIIRQGYKKKLEQAA